MEYKTEKGTLLSVEQAEKGVRAEQLINLPKIEGVYLFNGLTNIYKNDELKVTLIRFREASTGKLYQFSNFNLSNFYWQNGNAKKRFDLTSIIPKGKGYQFIDMEIHSTSIDKTLAGDNIYSLDSYKGFAEYLRHLKELKALETALIDSPTDESVKQALRNLGDKEQAKETLFKTDKKTGANPNLLIRLKFPFVE